jgi:hypothetical protein
MVPAPLFCAKTAPVKSAIVKIQSPAKYTNLLSFDAGFIVVSVANDATQNVQDKRVLRTNLTTRRNYFPKNKPFAKRLQMNI